LTSGSVFSIGADLSFCSGCSVLGGSWGFSSFGFSGVGVDPGSGLDSSLGGFIGFGAGGFSEVFSFFSGWVVGFVSASGTGFSSFFISGSGFSFASSFCSYDFFSGLAFSSLVGSSFLGCSF